MLTKEQRFAVVSTHLREMNCEQVRAAKTRLAIKSPVNNIQRSRSVEDNKRPGRRRIMLYTVQSVQDAITRRPFASTRRHSRLLCMIY